MSHRAIQILDALATAVQSDLHSVFKHRMQPVSEEFQELPASILRIGDDSPIDDDGASNLAYIDSVLTVEVEHLVRELDEQAAIEKLLDLRTLTHTKFMAGDRTAGISFVIDIKYAGASAPEIDVQTDKTAGALTSRWLVHYRMNTADPS